MWAARSGASVGWRVLAAGAVGVALMVAAPGAWAGEGDGRLPRQRPAAAPLGMLPGSAARVLDGALAGRRSPGSISSFALGDPVVLDQHADALGDTAKVPELTGALMAVFPDDPSTAGDESAFLAFAAATSSETTSGDWAVVVLDTTGDLLDDYRVVTPAVYMDPDTDYAAPVEHYSGTEWVPTGQYALWQRAANGYYVLFDWRAVGLTAARFAFGLTDEAVTQADWAPDDYVGPLVTLPPASPIPVAPSAPLGVVASPGDGSAVVSWAAPTSPGTHPVTDYLVTASTGGATCTTTGLTCTVPGLVNQLVYTFTVVARSAVGTSPPSTPSAAVVPQPFAKVVVSTRKSRSVLRVDVNPNLGRRYWRFRVHKLAADGTWQPKGTYRTAGAKETRTLNLRKGTYRVVVLARGGYQETVSAPVTLRR